MEKTSNWDRRRKTHYVIWEGHTPGIFDNWPDAEAQVNGFRKAKFKGFYSEEDAIAGQALGYEHFEKIARESRAAKKEKRIANFQEVERKLNEVEPSTSQSEYSDDEPPF